MRPANSYQVGGNHYQSDYQPWDLMLFLGLGYLEGSTIKYVCRWRKKNGIEDLKKALHYLNKMEESSPIRHNLSRQQVAHEVVTFAKANQLSDLEHGYVLSICQWQDHSDIRGSREFLFLLLDEAEATEKRNSIAVAEQSYGLSEPDQGG